MSVNGWKCQEEGNYAKHMIHLFQLWYNTSFRFDNLLSLLVKMLQHEHLSGEVGEGPQMVLREQGLMRVV